LVVGQVAGVSTPTKSNKDAIYLTCVPFKVRCPGAVDALNTFKEQSWS